MRSVHAFLLAAVALPLGGLACVKIPQDVHDTFEPEKGSEKSHFRRLAGRPSMEVDMDAGVATDGPLVDAAAMDAASAVPEAAPAPMTDDATAPTSAGDAEAPGAKDAASPADAGIKDAGRKP